VLRSRGNEFDADVMMRCVACVLMCALETRRPRVHCRRAASIMMAFSAEGGKKEQEGARASQVCSAVREHVTRGLQARARWREGTSDTRIDAAAAAASDRVFFLLLNLCARGCDCKWNSLV